MNEHSLRAALNGLRLGELRWLRQTGSTNAEAIAWALQGAGDFSVVLADEQTQGRGRQGRHWLTPAGAALALSVILRGQAQTASRRRSWLSDVGQNPGAPAEVLPRLTALGALAVCQALEVGPGLKPLIKWPNDVLLNGRKTCGVLVEAIWCGETLDSAVIGIGVNVSAQAVPPDEVVRFPATCVEEAAGQRVSREGLLRGILEQLLVWRPRLGEAVFVEAWMQRLAYRGERIRVQPGSDEAPGAELTGVLERLDLDGALVLRLDSGQAVHLHGGEIRPLDAASLPVSDER
jgi:BirA family biotin operon repressor/biotin-[acetyl-CoA-carboxylase] ligase